MSNTVIKSIQYKGLFKRFFIGIDDEEDEENLARAMAEIDTLGEAGQLCPANFHEKVAAIFKNHSVKLVKK